MSKIGNIGFSGFKKANPASTGSIVNPLQGVIGALDKYQSRLIQEEENSLKQKRWEAEKAMQEERLGIAKQQAKWKEEKRNREEKERKALSEFRSSYNPAADIASKLGNTSDMLSKDYETRARNYLAERMLSGEHGKLLEEQTGEFGILVTKANMPNYDEKSATQILAEIEPDYNKRFNTLYGKDAKEVLGLFSDKSIVSQEDVKKRLVQKALSDKNVSLEKAMPYIEAISSQYQSDAAIKEQLEKRAEDMIVTGKQ